MDKEEPKVLTRMRLSCCWGDNLNEKELNEVVDYINLLQQKVNQLESTLNEVKEWKEEFGDACTFSIVSNPSLGNWYYSLEDILENGGSNG